MFNSIDDLWSWLFGPAEPEAPAEPEETTTIGNHNTIPDTDYPQHTHQARSPVFKNKG